MATKEKRDWINEIKNISVESIIMIVLTIVILAVALVGIYLQLDTASDEPIHHQTIKLKENVLASNDLLINFENFEKSTLNDDITFMSISPLDTTICTLKLIQPDDVDRHVVVLLSDPNGLIRYSSVPLPNNNTDFNLNDAYKISQSGYIDINAISLKESNLKGIWQLNVYIYDSDTKLTTIASRPVELLPPQENSSDTKETIAYVYVIVMVLTFSILPLAFKYLFKIKK